MKRIQAEDTFFEAAMSGDYGLCLSLIQEGISVNAKHPKNGKTALVLMATRLRYFRDESYRRGIKALIRAGADVNARDGEGKTALMYAITSPRDQSIVRALLKAGADPSGRPNDHQTPLGLAIRQENVHAVKVLLAAGVRISKPSKIKRTALDEAVEVGNDEIIRLLTKAGAKPSPRRSEEVRSTLEKTPIDLVDIATGNVDGVLQKIAAGADVQVDLVQGRTPLHEAVMYGQEQLVSRLIQAGADVKARDQSGLTPLMLAAEASWTGRPDMRILDLLIRSGASVDARDRQGRTALIIAAEEGQEETVKLLIRAGADANTVDRKGIDAHAHALARGHRRIAQLLKQSCRGGHTAPRIESRGSTP